LKAVSLPRASAVSIRDTGENVLSTDPSSAFRKDFYAKDGGDLPRRRSERFEKTPSNTTQMVQARVCHRQSPDPDILILDEIFAVGDILSNDRSKPSITSNPAKTISGFPRPSIMERF
jgi:hypothetical protein